MVSPLRTSAFCWTRIPPSVAGPETPPITSLAKRIGNPCSAYTTTLSVCSLLCISGATGLLHIQPIGLRRNSSIPPITAAWSRIASFAAKTNASVAKPGLSVFFNLKRKRRAIATGSGTPISSTAPGRIAPEM